MTYLGWVLKGLAMGAANVIPGVSGGTIAFITGIYERLIAALKNLDLKAILLFFTGKWRELARHIDLGFLFFIFLGVAISIVSLAKVMTWAFTNHESLTLSFFFGLIIASILAVGKQIKSWDAGVVVALLIGTGIAAAIAFLPPAQPSEAFMYLMLCGAVAVCSMILPGLSGSYVLLLMGNYLLVLNAVSDFNLRILSAVAIGAIVGLVGFSHLLDFLFSKFKNTTIALLTGFVVGSLLIIWPWKATSYEIIGGKERAVGYAWLMPELDSTFFLAVAFALVGFFLVWVIDKIGARKSS
jgi:putative membrane protein